MKNNLVKQLTLHRVKQPLLIILLEVMGSLSLSLSWIYCHTLYCNTKDGKLFYSLMMLLVKKYLVKSSCICVHISFTPLLFVRVKSAIENSLFASTFVNYWSLLKYTIRFAQRRCVPRENMFSRVRLSS